MIFNEEYQISESGQESNHKITRGKTKEIGIKKKTEQCCLLGNESFFYISNSFCLLLWPVCRSLFKEKKSCDSFSEMLKFKYGKRTNKRNQKDTKWENTTLCSIKTMRGESGTSYDYNYICKKWGTCILHTST